MGVGAQALPLAPDHEAHLGVRLELDEAEDDLHAGGFQFAGKGDVALLVEAGFQFHHGGDGFAGFRRFDQGTGDRTIAAGTVEGLLDRYHIGIARCLAQELHHHIEGSHRGGARRCPWRGWRRSNPRRNPGCVPESARRVRGEQQIRPVIDDEELEIGKPKQPVHHEDAVALGVQRLGHEVHHVGRHAADRPTGGWRVCGGGASAPSHRHAPDPPPPPRTLRRVADQAEHPLLGGDEAGKQPLERQRDQILQQQEADSATCRGQAQRSDRAAAGSAAAHASCRRLPPAPASAPCTAPCWE